MIAQIGIAIFGVIAIFLTQSESESWRQYACLFGLVGQPFWFIATIRAKQWGMVFVSCLYTVAWLTGVMHLIDSWK